MRGYLPRSPLPPCHQGVTGIIEHDIQPAEVCVRLLDGSPRLLGVSYVERQRKDGLAETLFKLSDIVELTGGRRNVVSARKCGLGPDAA